MTVMNDLVETPELEREAAGAAGDWTDLGEEASLFEDGDCHGTVVNGVKVALFRIKGKVYALDDICTHGNACLSDGDVDGYEVECPLHGGAFDIRDGKALCAPLSRDTRVHPVWQHDSRILVRVEPK